MPPEGGGPRDPREKDLTPSQAPTLSGPPPRDSGEREQATVVSSLPLRRSFGPYLLLRLLGQGGMGEVYEAEHLETGRRVALKVLSQTLDSPTDRERFLREGRLAAQVNHPHSIYVYGTEEIEGTPVIAMELVTGGSLKDRVREKGPLSPTEAVDATLEIVSGLEAAAALGVLHRDIKPSNCFIDSEGAVKIGDFGLSISTLARDETQLTATGTFLGTPSFASPEQLRCEELDVRSDIYSVGATLYYLLTGKAPFEEEQIVKLLSMILQKAPDSPRKVQRQIAKGLARAVLRCLEKDRAARFANYAALRKELLPFSSTATTPATLGLRFAAGIIDGLVFSIPAVVYMYGGTTSRQLDLLTPIPFFVLLVAEILYFALPEGLWGASLGKALCRIRVVGPGRQVPGLRRAFIRAFLFVAATSVPEALFVVTSERSSATETKAVTVGLFELLLIASLFVTARRRNGFAGLHDLASDTRVVRKPTHEARPAMITAAVFSPRPATERRIGPYSVVGTLREGGDERLLLGYDESLRRHTWIHLPPAGTPPIDPSGREISRPGRLRWLNGRRTATESWDAYEALEGRALLDLVSEKQRWISVRHWLLNLAEEWNAAWKDGSLPACLAVDRVWITRDGRAKLLDFPAPIAHPDDPPRDSRSFGAADLASVQAFLHHVAVAATAGRTPTSEEAFPPVPSVPLPLPVRSFLKGLSDPGGHTSQTLLSSLQLLTQASASVSPWKRFGHLAISGSLGLFFLVVLSIVLVAAQWASRKYPDFERLRAALSRLDRLERGGCGECPERRLLEIYISGHFRGVLSGPSRSMQLVLVRRQQKLAQSALARHPDPPAEEVARAAQEVKPLLERSGRRRMGDWKTLVYMPAVFLAFTGLLSLVCAILFRGGALLRAFGIAVIRPDGTEASRPRTFFRALIAWSPCLLFLLPFLPGIAPPPRAALSLIARLGWAAATAATIVPIGVALSLIALFVAGAAWAVITPERGLQDRVAGTFLVPR